ncbi:MAG TPA: hypothetical protein VGM90_30390 [Kofleriaceae bacterium]
MIGFDGTCDLAVWCKTLRDKGWTGPRIAREIAKSEGYVNNLIRVIDRVSPTVLMRWKTEQGAPPDSHVCATDWLVQVCLLPHDAQDAELKQRLTHVMPAEPTPAPA